MLPACFCADFGYRPPMPLDIKDLVTSRLGENYELHDRHLNRTLVKVQRTIGFDIVYARAEGSYLYDMDGKDYLDFLSGFGLANRRDDPASGHLARARRDHIELVFNAVDHCTRRSNVVTDLQRVWADKSSKPCSGLLLEDWPTNLGSEDVHEPRGPDLGRRAVS